MHRPAIVTLGVLASFFVLGFTVPARALELPTAALASCWFRINGPRVDPGGGDWYTSSLSGSTERRHIYKIIAPHGAAFPISLQILSAQSVSGSHPDVIGAGVADPTRVRVLNPSGSVHFEQTADGGGSDVSVMLMVPGTYTLIVEAGVTALGLPASADRDDDRNAYRLSVTPDGSATPGDASDDVSIGFVQSSIVCQSAETELPLAASMPTGTNVVAFRNFNTVGSDVVTYTLAPSPPDSGTLSGAGVWNGSSGSLDAGEDRPTGGAGYWTSTLVALPAGQQVVFEARADGTRVPFYFNAGVPLPRVGLADFALPAVPPDAFIGIPRLVSFGAVNLGPVTDRFDLTLPVVDSGMTASLKDFMMAPLSSVIVPPSMPGPPSGIDLTIAMTVMPNTTLNATLRSCSFNQAQTGRGAECKSAVVPVLALTAPVLTSPMQMATVPSTFTATGTGHAGVLVSYSVDMGMPQPAGVVDPGGTWSALVPSLTDGPHTIDFFFEAPGGAFTGIPLTITASGTPPPADAGPPNVDAGMPNEDAGPPNQDAGPPNADAGPPDPDAGPPNADAGPPNADAGPPNADGGPPNADGGSPFTPTFTSPTPGGAYFSLPRFTGVAPGATNVSVLLDDVPLPEAAVEPNGRWEATVPAERSVAAGDHVAIAVSLQAGMPIGTSEPVSFFLAIEQPGSSNSTKRPTVGLTGGACSGGACSGSGTTLGGLPLWLLLLALWSMRQVHGRRVRRARGLR